MRGQAVIVNSRCVILEPSKHHPARLFCAGPPIKRGTLKGSECLEKKGNEVYLVPRIASLAALATRNFTTRLALIWMVAPVAGLRPVRALRFTRTSLPRPGRVKVSLACL